MTLRDHQTSEPGIKLLLHELRSARDLLRTDAIRTDLKRDRSGQTVPGGDDAPGVRAGQAHAVPNSILN